MDGKGRMKKQLEREAQNQTENRESEKPRQAEDTLDRQEETKLRFDLGFLYFLDLEDYEKAEKFLPGQQRRNLSAHAMKNFPPIWLPGRKWKKKSWQISWGR